MIHPVTAYRSRFYIWWLIWLISGLGQSLLLLYITDIGPLAAFTDGMLSSVIFSLLAIAVWFPVKQFIGSTAKTSVLMVNHLLLGIITLVIWLLLVRLVTGSLPPDPESFHRFWNQTLNYRQGIW